MSEYYLSGLKQSLAKSAQKLVGSDETNFSVEIANPKFEADLAIPCFEAAKQLNRSPNELAQQVASGLSDDGIEKLTAISGFVNIWLRPEVIAKELESEFNRSQAYGTNNSLSNQAVVIEYTDPNPFKEFHIGHAYSNTVGESIARLYEAAGASVHRVSYHGDVGMHVAKAIWGIKRLLTDEKLSLEQIPANQRAVFLGRAYAAGAKAFDNDESQKQVITELNTKIYKLDDENLRNIYETGRKWSFEYFETIYKRLQVSFEKRYLESETTQRGSETVRAHIGDVFEESEGAVVFRGEAFGLHTRVFINNQGIATYEAKDLGLAIQKNEDFHYDESIVITGHEQSAYFEVMLKALEQIHPDLAKKTKHIAHGQVVLPEGKMSSRSGEVITAVWLLDKLKGAIQSKAQDSPAVAQNTLAALKYSFLKADVGSDLVFSIDEAINLEGQTGPYIQYAGVRINSILNADKVTDDKNPKADYKWLEEKELLLLCLQYPEIVADASQKLQPHLIAGFVYELARAFNRYYEKTPVLKADEAAKSARLALLQYTLKILEHGLELMNIPMPEKM